MFSFLWSKIIHIHEEIFKYLWILAININEIGKWVFNERSLILNGSKKFYDLLSIPESYFISYYRIMSCFKYFLLLQDKLLSVHSDLQWVLWDWLPFGNSGKRKHYCRTKFRCCLAIYLILPVSFPVRMPWSLCCIHMRNGIPRGKINCTHSNQLWRHELKRPASYYRSKGGSKSTYVQTANENVFILFTPMAFIFPFIS